MTTPETASLENQQIATAPIKRPTPKRRQEKAHVEWLAHLSAEEVCRRLEISGKDGFYKHEREWIAANPQHWPEMTDGMCERAEALRRRDADTAERRRAIAKLQGKRLLGGATGELRCACGNQRYPGCDVCPQCGFGENFDPMAHAQAEKRAELVRAGKEDPKQVGRLAAQALNYARWLVEQGYVGWPLAYKRATKKYGVAESAIRQLAAQRSATTRTTRR
jgi:hypothetical protein